MRRAISILILVLAAIFVGDTAIAAASGGLAVELNRSRRVVLPGTPANISVADPTIADVTVIDARSVVVIGKSYGITDIIVSDHSGRLLMDSRVTVVPPETQRLTVYRGVTPTEYTCLTRCQSEGEAAASSASSSAAGPADTANAAAIAQPPVSVTPSIPRSPP
jgi:Flp pilus assembly secretin CpaC